MNKIQSFARTPLILSLAVLMIFFEILFKSVLGPRFLELSNGTPPLDMTVGYSPEEAYQILGQYGQAGRDFYNYFQLADFFFPIVYSLLLMVLIFRLVSANNLSQSPLRWLIYLPLAAGFCDWLENLGIFTMLRFYPQRSDIIAIMTNLACVVKFSGIILSMILVLVLFIAFLIRKMIHR